MPRFDQVLVFCVMSLLVGLFAWIYLRNRERKSGLWLLGWSAILLHCATPLVASQIHWCPPICVLWVNRATLMVAGAFFLFSVSSFRSRSGPTPWFVAAILFSGLGYLTLLLLHFRQPWAYLTLLMTGLSIAIGRAFYKNGPKSRFVWFLIVALVPYTIWAAIQALHGKPARGFDVFLYGVFAITGALYYRHFRRLSPGVLLSSISFVAWGAVFPVASFLIGKQILVNGIVWDLPKYFVAFGMVVTLFENEAEVALEVADKFRTLFEDNVAAVYVSSLDGKLLDCNGAFVSMYGFSSKEESLASLNSLSFCDGNERESFIRRLRQEGQVLNHECRHHRKDGTPFWILERATIVKAGNGDRVIEGTAIDITERKHAELALKQSEERFSKIFRQSPVGCCIVSLEGRFLDVNDDLLKMLGREASDVIGRTALSLRLWKNQQQRENFFADLRKKGSLRNLHVEFEDSAGNHRQGIYCATLVRVGDKECIFGMLVDQTEQKELEAKFLQAQKMEALGRLAGGIAHDFNNLLGVIGGYAELLETKLEFDQNLRHYCSKILGTTQRAGGLTRQLLTFSRKEVTRPMPLRPDQVIRELAGILPRMLGDDIELSLDLRSTGVVVMDQTHFEQIVINVVINSRDAMPHGGQMFIETEDVFRPIVNVEGALEGHYCVALSLRDTGCGMTEEIRAHAFEPFYTTKELGRGTGLGLATVYGVVQQSKGEIKLESNPGQGTRISIFLPASGDSEISKLERQGEEVLAGSGNILLVEDEADLRASNAEFLTSIGYSVRCAGNGHEALAMVNDQGPIDLVISDVIMPKMNGREFADRLLHARPMTKMLFVSGYADDVLSQTGFPDVETPFLQKPYSLRELGAKVQQVLQNGNGFAASAD